MCFLCWGIRSEKKQWGQITQEETSAGKERGAVVELFVDARNLAPGGADSSKNNRKRHGNGHKIHSPDPNTASSLKFQISLLYALKAGSGRFRTIRFNKPKVPKTPAFFGFLGLGGSSCQNAPQCMKDTVTKTTSTKILSTTFNECVCTKYETNPLCKNTLEDATPLVVNI